MYLGVSRPPIVYLVALHPLISPSIPRVPSQRGCPVYPPAGYLGASYSMHLRACVFDGLAPPHPFDQVYIHSLWGFVGLRSDCPTVRLPLRDPVSAGLSDPPIQRSNCHWISHTGKPQHRIEVEIHHRRARPSCPCLLLLVLLCLTLLSFLCLYPRWTYLYLVNGCVPVLT